jgi:hypothetical protein
MMQQGALKAFSLAIQLQRWISNRLKKFILAHALLILSCLVSIPGTSQSITIHSFCAFSYSLDNSRKAPEDSIFFKTNAPTYCGNKITMRYTSMNSNDTIRKAINRILLDLNLSTDRVVLGSFDYSAVTGIFFKPDSSTVCHILCQTQLKNEYWKAIGIVSHELGHYLNDNENLCSNKDIELDADYFAGRAMAFLGATKEECIQCFSVSSAKGDSIHPPRSERIERCLAAFQNYFKSIKITSFTSANPVVYWMKFDDCDSIYIDDYKFSIPKLKGWDTLFTNSVRAPENLIGFIDPNLGILYLTKTNSTYELNNFKKDQQGIGSLVNDKTSLTYMRFGSRFYRIYNKSKIVKFDEVNKENNRMLENNLDYLVNIKNIDKKDGDIVIFKNYAVCPIGKLMPAFYK